MEKLKSRVYYNGIVDNNIYKLMGSDSVIEEYIERIYPQMLVGLLADENKENFVEEQIDEETDEPVEGSPPATTAFERISYYIKLVHPNFKKFP